MTGEQLSVLLVLYVMHCTSPLDIEPYEGVLTEKGLGQSMTGQKLRVSLVLYITQCKSLLDIELYVGILTEIVFL